MESSFRPVSVEPPICMTCRHFNRDDKTGLTCAAFPDGIPDVILRSVFIHTKPYPGDHGIQYERDPSIPPVRDPRLE